MIYEKIRDFLVYIGEDFLLKQKNCQVGMNLVVSLNEFKTYIIELQKLDDFVKLIQSMDNVICFFRLHGFPF
jgi:hypothetical protein